MDTRFGANGDNSQKERNRNPRLNRKHEIFNNYLGQFCNQESIALTRDQHDRQVQSDLNPETEDLENQLRKPEDAEASNEEESIGDENEPLPQNLG